MTGIEGVIAAAEVLLDEVGHHRPAVTAALLALELGQFREEAVTAVAIRAHQLAADSIRNDLAETGGSLESAVALVNELTDFLVTSCQMRWVEATGWTVDRNALRWQEQLETDRG